MKKIFDWERFRKEKIAVYCKTEEEAKDFCQKMHELGMTWSDGRSYLEYTFYSDYNENTCYEGRGFYGKRSRCERNGYEILEWSDYMENEFTKADLKDGMVVEYCNGKRRLVLNNRLIGKDGYYELNQYMEDMKDKESSERDIMRVFKIGTITTLDRIFHIRNLELIWERSEIKHMTTEEMRHKLEELTGEKIEVEPSREEMIGTCYEFCRKQVCSRGCILSQFEDCCFKKNSDEQLKQCYEKVIANGNSANNI